MIYVLFFMLLFLMFLIVGEFLKQDTRIDVGLQERTIVKEFWNLMEEKGYVHIRELRFGNGEFRIDIGRNSNFSALNSQISYIISRGAHFKYTKKVLENFPNLKAILLAQIGNDNVDVEYCRQRGIEVVNFVSEKSIYSVAEQTVFGLIGGIRQAYYNRDKLKMDVSKIRIDEGRIGKDNYKVWERSLGKNLDESITIGIMGFGRIGQKVAELMSVFPCKIIAYDVLFNGIDEGRMEKDKVDEKTYKIIGLAMEVHNQLGSGLQEKVYHQAFASLLEKSGFKVEKEKKIEIKLNGEKVGYSKCDIVVDKEIAIELKSEPYFKREHFKQLRKYVNFGGFKGGLLFNFFPNKLQFKRLNLNISIPILPKSFTISETLQKLLNNGKLQITGNLDYFLQNSNYISVHILGFEENLGLLNYSKLQNVRGVVNMARAGIVVEDDILKLLDKGQMEFYVSDVVEGEPYIEKINQKLIKHPKVFVTPHIGANTYQVQVDILALILDYLKGQNF